MAFQPAWLLYGATGYTGRLIAAAAVKAGLQPILGGRNEATLRALAESLGLKHRVCDLEQRASLDRALSGVRLVLNAAGPFAITTAPLAGACLLNGVHYLDIASEVADLRALHRMHERAVEAGVMLLPGVGFGVLPTDCLALSVFQRRPRTALMKIGVVSGRGVSRGTLRTLLHSLQMPGVVRERGELKPAPAGVQRWSVSAGKHRLALVGHPWRGDLFSAGLSTGLPHIETFIAAPWLLRVLMAHPNWVAGGFGARLVQRWLQRMPSGPTAASRAQSRSLCIVEAVDEDGRRAMAWLEGPQAYDLTAACAVYAVQQVLAGHTRDGFATPAQVLGTAPLRALPGCTLHET